MAAVNTSVGASGSGTSLTTGSVSPGGSNRAVYATACSNGSYAAGAKYGGSGGTSLTKVSADQALAFFSGGFFNGWGAAGSPSGSTTGYVDYGVTSQDSTTSFIFLTGVDQTTPFGTEVTASDLAAPVTSMVASVSLTGLLPGQLVVAGLGVLTFFNVSITSNNAATTVVAAQQGSGGNKDSTAILYGFADGSGNLTLAALIDESPSSDLIAWCLSALPVNDAAGGASHDASGALAAQSATVTGSATHLTLHATSGALAAQAATVTGTAQHRHTTTGALAAQSATVTGSATHLTLHASSGALAAQSAAVTGAAQHPHTTTGALAAQAATVTGDAVHTAPNVHAATGDLAAQAATVTGSATHLTLHASSGALAAQAAAVTGTAAHPHTTAGALAAQAAVVTGTADHTAAGVHNATGDLQAQPATMSGAAELTATGQNVLDAKYLGGKRKNVAFKPLKKPEADFVPEAIDPPTPAEVKAAVKARGLDMSLLPEPAPAPAPAKKAPKPSPKPAPKPAPVAAPAAPVAPPPPPPAPPAPDPIAELAKAITQQNDALRAQVGDLAAALAKANETLAGLTALQTEARGHQQITEQAFDAEQARRTRNRKRAEHLAKQFLSD